MKTDDVGVESLGDGLDGVRVGERDEVGTFAEPIDHDEDDRLAPHARKCLDEVDGDVRPHTLWDWQREKEVGRLQVLRLVALARDTFANKVCTTCFMLGEWKSRRSQWRVRWTPSWPSSYTALRISCRRGDAGAM